MPLLHEALDDFDHLRNVFRGPGLHESALPTPQTFHVLLIGGDIFTGNLGRTDAFFSLG